MKLTSIYLCLISIGVFELTVGLCTSRPWVALAGAAVAYAAAGGYRWETRRQKGARR